MRSDSSNSLKQQCRHILLRNRSHPDATFDERTVHSQHDVTYLHSIVVKATTVRFWPPHDIIPPQPPKRNIYASKKSYVVYSKTETFALERKASCKIGYASKLYYLPMLRHVAEPLDAGGLETDVGVEAAGDGAVDDGLPLLLQQRDELLLGADVSSDAVVDVIEVSDDGALFGEGWEGYLKRTKLTLGYCRIRSPGRVGGNAIRE